MTYSEALQKGLMLTSARMEILPIKIVIAYFPLSNHTYFDLHSFQLQHTTSSIQSRPNLADSLFMYRHQSQHSCKNLNKVFEEC